MILADPDCPKPPPQHIERQAGNGLYTHIRRIKPEDICLPELTGASFLELSQVEGEEKEEGGQSFPRAEGPLPVADAQEPEAAMPEVSGKSTIAPPPVVSAFTGFQSPPSYVSFGPVSFTPIYTGVVAAVPEPAEWALFGCGLLALLGMAGRNKR